MGVLASTSTLALLLRFDRQVAWFKAERKALSFIVLKDTSFFSIQFPFLKLLCSLQFYLLRKS